MLQNIQIEDNVPISPSASTNMDSPFAGIAKILHSLELGQSFVFPYDDKARNFFKPKIGKSRKERATEWAYFRKATANRVCKHGKLIGIKLSSRNEYGRDNKPIGIRFHRVE